jgi:hypothetical protein
VLFRIKRWCWNGIMIIGRRRYQVLVTRFKVRRREAVYFPPFPIRLERMGHPGGMGLG